MDVVVHCSQWGQEIGVGKAHNGKIRVNVKEDLI